MSWFDTGGIATLAKTALKDMQKHIDKALDINDDETAAMNKSVTDSSESSTNKTNENISDAQQDSVWGSFTGSFFPISGAQQTPETVTSPPKKQLSKTSSESESLEIISPPITPGSVTLSTTSPAVSSSIALGSESVEIIGTSTTEEISPELFTPDSVLSDSMMKSPGSVEIISEEDVLEDISEDSMSYNTVSEVPITVFEPQLPGKPISRQNLHLLLTTSTVPDSMANSSDSEHTIVSDKGATLDSFEYQTQISSSTQSFEEIPSQHQSEGELSIKVESQKQAATVSSEPSTRDQQSPNSSEDKSDVEIVKISASDQTSGQTSGDETTTSSDIEIISSPNGDSSSTNSVPVKNFQKNLEMLQVIKRQKGHSRELSEISVQSDDSSNQSETEKLLRRISELSEILEQREYKLVEIGRQNAELHEQNQEIMSKLEAKKKQSDSLEVTNVTVLSGLEKKFQQSIREREVMRKQVTALKAELTAKINKSESDQAIAEKEQMIEELRAEGEGLSKQVLQHSTIIKKLRAKEKETDAMLKRQKEQIEEQAEEAERLKKSLSAKEVVERTQIEAVNRLSSDKRRLEKENLQMKSQLDDLGQKLETLQTSFDAAKRELTEKQNIHTHLNKQTEAYSNLEAERQRLRDENDQLVTQIDELRQKLRQMEAATVTREQTLRRENTELLQKLQAAEMRGEDQQTEITMATIPLVRQLESLQSTLNARTKKFERQERDLIEKLDSAKMKMDAQKEHEAVSKEKIFTLNTTIASLEEKLQAALLRAEQSEAAMQQKQLEQELKSSEYRNEAKRLHDTETTLLACQQKIKELEEAGAKDRDMFDTERKKLVQELKKARELQDNTLVDRDGSPTLSLGGRSSLNDSLTSNHWQMDDLDCSLSNSGRLAGVSAHYQPPLTATSVLENLQSTLKQREGEILQQQWELSRLQSEKNYLTTEVGNLIAELDTIRETLSGHEAAMREFSELREQHDAILQLYGGLLEANEELKLDLLESKQAYRTQIDELLQQKREGRL